MVERMIKFEEDMRTTNLASKYAPSPVISGDSSYFSARSVEKLVTLLPLPTKQNAGIKESFTKEEK